MVDIRYRQTFQTSLPLDRLRQEPKLKGMVLLRKVPPLSPAGDGGGMGPGAEVSRGQGQLVAQRASCWKTLLVREDFDGVHV